MSTLASLRTTVERIAGNYSSYQMLSTLDDYLFNAVKPVIRYSDYMDYVLGNVAGWGGSRPSRKLSTQDFKLYLEMLFAYLAVDDRRVKWGIIKDMRLERNILFQALNRLCSAFPDKPDLIKPALLKSFGFVSEQYAWSSIQECRYWFSRAVEMKAMIMEKYLRLVFLETQNFYLFNKQNNPSAIYDLDEVAQNFIIHLSKAIDKCDTNHGTLTTYIRNWLQSAKSSPAYRSEYGLAYLIPSTKRKNIAIGIDDDVNIAVAMDDEAVQQLASDETPDIVFAKTQGENILRLIAKEADPLGLARLHLGIAEVLSDREKDLLKS